MTSSPTSSNSHPTYGLFYEPPSQNAITAGTGWDKNLGTILHLHYGQQLQYSSYKEIASAYAEILQLLEASHGNLVGFCYRSHLKQILSTAENFVQYSKWNLADPPPIYGELFRDSSSLFFRGEDIADPANFCHQSKSLSSKIEAEISLLRNRTGLEQRYKDFDNRSLLGFITRVSKILAEISIAIFVCMTILAMALPWHWKFIISKAMFALAVGAIAYFGFDVSKRMQRFALAVQILYMHYFLFIWAWNDLKAFLTQIAESDDPVSDMKGARQFLWAFKYSFFGKEEELELLQMRISASPAYGTKGEPRFWQSIGSAAPSGRKKIA